MDFQAGPVESNLSSVAMCEPDVSDLHYIARDMGLRRATLLSRNWAGYASRYPAVRTLVPFVDGLLRYRPSLCSDIYLLGQKPQS
ncbi:hypothetical protein SacmaDRAFT_3241 [Saccharomonospora marina XMU15]|uniref:Uncharacterized protein n=2 Tax=Saccharomonospora TaxID=1851 RepID=H5X9M8_9PSEU|nr:hypothetical protein SacmaDRAFT_3241 [Saccharomonospora marina XMU15]